MAKSSKKSKSLIPRTLHYWWQITKRYKGATATSFLLTPVVILANSLLIPFFVAEIIDVVAQDPTQAEIFQRLAFPAIMVVLLQIICQVILHQIRWYVSWKMEVKATTDLGILCFSAIEAQSMQFHSDHFSGSLVSQTNRFVNAYESLIDELMFSVIPLAFTVVPCTIALFIVAPIVGAIVVMLAILYSIIAIRSSLKIIDINEAEASAHSKAIGQLSDAISNVASVKSYAREEYEIKRYTKICGNWKNVMYKMINSYLTRNTLFDLTGTINIAACIFFMLVGSHWFGFSAGVLILIWSYSRQIIDQLRNLGQIMRKFNKIFGDAHDMTEILDMKDDVIDLPDAKTLKVKDAEILFNHIYFKHSDARDAIFEDFSLDVKPGERIGLVGVSGSGKTTLTKLLLRFADVEQGTVTIDGEDIKHITQKSLRESIAYVPQETALFHRSISENIAYGKLNATKEEIKRAAKLANADEFIKRLPDGYETLVGERGIKLSGGQRQRIAIARAILKDAPILVLDEATSALDSESEALIQEALIQLMKNRTSIVIAHRLSTVASLDRIVVLDNGKIVEQGTHKELLAKNGHYAKLWTRQSGGFLDEN